MQWPRGRMFLLLLIVVLVIGSLLLAQPYAQDPEHDLQGVVVTHCRHVIVHEQYTYKDEDKLVLNFPNKKGKVTLRNNSAEIMYVTVQGKEGASLGRQKTMLFRGGEFSVTENRGFLTITVTKEPFDSKWF